MTKTTHRSPQEVERTLNLLGISPDQSMYEDCKELAKRFVAWQIVDVLQLKIGGINV